MREKSIILSHFSAVEFELEKDKKYEISTPANFKPRGLWLSDENPKVHGWKSWCEGEDFGLHRLKYETRFKVPLEHIIHLKNAQDIKQFTKDYRRPDYRFPEFLYDEIDWETVKSKYKGILITPYCWEVRLDIMWYYGWDCASACLWDLSILEEVPPLAVSSPYTEMSLATP